LLVSPWKQAKSQLSLWEYAILLFLRWNKQNSKIEILGFQWSRQSWTWISRDPPIDLFLTLQYVKTLVRAKNKSIEDFRGCPRSSTIFNFCLENKNFFIIFFEIPLNCKGDYFDHNSVENRDMITVLFSFDRSMYEIAFLHQKNIYCSFIAKVIDWKSWHSFGHSKSRLVQRFKPDT
jgi:hypothetical protein